MGRDLRQEAFEYLLKKAEKQGYITFDDIMDCADEKSLPIQDFDWLSSAIATHGIIIYDEVPKNSISDGLMMTAMMIMHKAIMKLFMIE